jgi:hypothetical protein
LLAFGLCADAYAQNHSVALNWIQERISNRDVVQRVAQPSLSGLHAFDLTPDTTLRVAWDMAPHSDIYITKPRQMLSDVDINFAKLSLDGRHGSWFWTAGIQPAMLDDQTVRPISIYSADFDQETAVSEQLLLGLGWEGEYLRLNSAIFRRSPLDLLHVHLGRHRPAMTWGTGLTDTNRFGSWLLSLGSKDRARAHWHVEYAHLSTDRPAEHDARQWMVSWSGQGPFSEKPRWDIELGDFRHFRGTANHARRAMLSWSHPIGAGIVQLAGASRWRSSFSSAPDTIKMTLTELSYATQFAENWHVVFGGSTVRDASGKSSAIGIMASYALYAH